MTFFDVAKLILTETDEERDFREMQELLDKQEASREYSWNVEGND